jgi:hypothetical protein
MKVTSHLTIFIPITLFCVLISLNKYLSFGWVFSFILALFLASWIRFCIRNADPAPKGHRVRFQSWFGSEKLPVGTLMTILFSVYTHANIEKESTWSVPLQLFIRMLFWSLFDHAVLIPIRSGCSDPCLIMLFWSLFDQAVLIPIRSGCSDSYLIMLFWSLFDHPVLIPIWSCCSHPYSINLFSSLFEPSFFFWVCERIIWTGINSNNWLTFF